MKEIINICLSQSAGHLQCHFNNQQESYLDYDGKKNEVDHSIFLKPVINKLNNTVSYTPRTILLDCHNGFGSLGKYEYLETLKKDELVDKIEKIQLQTRIDKNEYQKLLDSGTMVPELNKNNTKFWTDYTRLIYDARSFNEVKNWELDPDLAKTVMRSDPSREITEFRVGENEYDKNLMDDVVRVFLEECDNLQGVNIVSEMDSSWGGLCHELVLDLKDEYLPKTVCTTWGLYDNKLNDELSMAHFLNRVRSTIYNLSNSSLFVPLSLPSNNLWESCGQITPVFETVNLMYAMGVTSMNDFINGITMGINKRNLVTDIKLDDENLTSLVMGQVKEQHFFSKSVISRFKSNTSNNFEELISLGTNKLGLIEYKLPIYFNPPSSFPNIEIGPEFYVSMGTSDKLQLSFKKMKLAVMKIKDDERLDLIEEIEDYLLEYQFGWSDDEEYD